MKIKEIVQLADAFLQTETPPALFSKTVLDAELTAALSVKPLSLLLSCVNLTLSEAAAEYLPLVSRQKVTPIEGKILYSAFEKDIVTLLRIMDKNGTRLRYRYRPSYIEADAEGECDAVYSYRPNYKGFLEEAEKGSSALTARVVAYGAAAEYCLITGRYEEAVTWDKRYKEGLQNCCKSKNGQLAPRLFR